MNRMEENSCSRWWAARRCAGLWSRGRMKDGGVDKLQPAPSASFRRWPIRPGLKAEPQRGASAPGLTGELLQRSYLQDSGVRGRQQLVGLAHEGGDIARGERTADEVTLRVVTT